MSAHAVDLGNAEPRLAELVAEVVRGGEIVFTQNGQAIAKLVPVEHAAAVRREFGSARGLIHMRGDFDEPLEEFREYME